MTVKGRIHLSLLNYIFPSVKPALLFLTFCVSYNFGVAQGSISSELHRAKLSPSDADSSYILQYKRANDIRLLYGGVGTSLAFGSVRNGNELNTQLFNNVNDLIGVGITYKIIDFDISYSLPKSAFLEEDRQNLKQFRLAMSYTARQIAVRGFYLESQGMISADAAREFTSQPDIELKKMGAQITYIFNEKKYSYRAANYQTEQQQKIAGSFLLRAEPYYRNLKAPTGLVPKSRDLETTYGNQVGLQTAHGLGLLLMPGYGINIPVFHNFLYISPIIMAGPGVAYNTYIGEKGKFDEFNYEWSALAYLNIGYNGNKMYANMRTAYEIYYVDLSPSYLTTNDLRINLTVGYRFNNLENFIPTSLF